jgi:predicted nucleic acid-binding protein
VIHLDTNFLIDALVPGSAQESQLIGWLDAEETLGISALAWGELLCGPLSATAETFVRKLLSDAEPLGRSDAEKAAQLFNHTGDDPRLMLTAALPLQPFEPMRH